MPATAPQLSARHLANRHQVVQDIAAFLLQHFAGTGSYAETVRAALDHARQLDPVEWFALGILAGHYRHGSSPDPATTTAVIAYLERLLPAPVTAGPVFEGIR